jgi:hypothetical protein
MSTNQMTNFVIDQPRMINGKEYLVTTVNGFDRVQINNKLHDIGEVILNLKMEQDRLVQMRSLIDRQHEETEDLFDELFGARPIKRAIQDKIEDLISEKILTNEVVEGKQYLLFVKEEGDDQVIVLENRSVPEPKKRGRKKKED